MTHLRVSLRHAVLSLVAVIAVLGAGVAIAAPSDDDKGEGRQSARGERELPELRSRMSNTYATERGTNRTRISTVPVNFRDGGTWKPIQNELKDSATPGYAFENAANHWSVKIPDALESKPVEVRDGDEFVRYSPVGAKGSPGKLGATAGFRDIYPGVDATYEVQTQGVKETLILASPQARAAYEFDVDVSDGIEAREGKGGSVEFVDADGDVRFAFSPPTLEDAAGADSTDASMRLTRHGSGYRVVLKAEREWLEDPARRYPVELDPTTTVKYPSPDCYMVGGTGANTTYCGYAFNWLDVGTDPGGDQRRSFLQYDTTGIPTTADVVEGEFWFNIEAGASREVHLHRATRASTQARTWNKYDGVNNWTTPGGDITATADGKGNMGGTTGYQRIQARQLVQDWVDKTHANNGVILKDGSGTNNVLKISASDQGTTYTPQLDIEWVNRIGDQGRWTFADQQLSDRATLRTNVANGNLLLQEKDIQIPGIAGHDLDFSRSFNSKDVSGGGGDMGHNWNNSTGYDVWLNSEGASSTEAFQGPSGFWAVYDKNPDGSYKTPTGMNADLKKNTDGTFTLTYRSSNRKLNFDANGTMTSDKDRNDNAITFAYGGPGGKLSAVKDTHEQNTANNTLSVTYNGSGYIQTITDRLTPTARTWTYNYTGNKLTSYVNPDGKTTSYGYNASNDLTTITDARGTVTTITYDTEHRVTEIWRDSANSGPKTKYEYPATLSTDCQGVGTGENTVVGETIEKDPLWSSVTPNAHRVKYCWDKLLRVQKTVDGRGKTRQQGYTANSDINKLTSAGNQAWDLSFDGNDRSQKAESPATTTGGPRMTQQFGYDSTISDKSNPKFWLASTYTDERNQQVGYQYDAKGNLTDVNLPLATQNNIHLVYNADGTTQSVRDANTTGTTAYGYTNGNVTSIDRQAPLGDESLTYDSVHRVATQTDGRSQVATYTYDKLDRMTNIAYTGGATIAYTYDNVGNMTQRVDNTGTSTYVFDRLNRLTQENPAGRETTNWTYDLAGNAKTLVDGGGTTTYNYGVSNLLDSMTAPGDSAATTFTYTDDDARKTTTYPNGVVMSADWEDGSAGNQGPGRLKKIEAKKGTTTISSFTYGYSPSTSVCGGTTSSDTELRHSVTDKNGNTARYCYDGLNRLIKADNHGGQNYTYDLDGNGNIKKRVKGATTTSYGFNAANQMCWSVGNSQASAACTPTPTGATTYAYDAAGNLDTSTGGLNLDYNAKEQTTSMNSLTGGTSHTKVYAGPGQFERTTAGPITYTHNALGIGSEVNAGATTRYRRDNDGGLHSERLSGGSLFYYVFDGLGSVVALTDSAGSAPTTYTYDPYGETTRTGTTFNPWRYASGYQDSGSEFYKFGTRYYMPTLGRWTQQDPKEEPTDPLNANRYGYAGGNPINMTDPDGQFAIALAPVAVVATAAVASAATVAVGYGVYKATEGSDDDTDDGHSNNQRPSTREQHEKGNARRGRQGNRRKGIKPKEKKRQHPGWYDRK
jgi:RHS repeat-associated protein